MTLTNHDKFEIIFYETMIKNYAPDYLNLSLFTNEIKEIVIEISEFFKELHIKDTSILPNDHAEGNNTPCTCSGKSTQIFNRKEKEPNASYHKYFPRSINGSSDKAKEFFENHNIVNSNQATKNDIIHDGYTGKNISCSSTYRQGQNIFRRLLIQEFCGCAVTGCEEISVLKASHIKPWRYADKNEKIDVHNGLLLTPNLDELFDSGKISFTENGAILLSKSISAHDYNLLGISQGMNLQRTSVKTQKYLTYHRENIFKNN